MKKCLGLTIVHKCQNALDSINARHTHVDETKAVHLSFRSPFFGALSIGEGRLYSVVSFLLLAVIIYHAPTRSGPTVV